MPARTFAIIMTAALLMGATACAPVTSNPDQGRSGNQAAGQENTPPVAAETVKTPPAQPAARLPLRYQRPAYLLPEEGLALALEPEAEALRVPVGADIASAAGPVPLRDILRRLAGMKKMNISWASDVDQHVPVDVNIRAEDDFFESIANLLRQVDYFHEMERNTIVVKYRETKSFHVGMPFIATTYSTGVGGDVLGASGIDSEGASGNLIGNIQLTSNDNRFDVWENIRNNLDQILDIWEETVQTSGNDDDGKAEGGTVTRRNVQAGKGYYAIDKPIGLITVNAPRPLIEKIETYLNNLKEQLFRQISIEAKIIEVNLEDTARTGIDWRQVLSGKRLDFQVFGPDGIIYPNTARGISQVTVGPDPFRLLLDAIEEQGQTNVLANPRISVLNGQPALITVGKTMSYVKEVKREIDRETQVTTYTPVIGTIMSGLGLSVLPTITDNGSIVLSLTPVTSQVEEPILSRMFGNNIEVMLPNINIRELKSIVKVGNGDTLLIGGLIDSVDDVTTGKVPLLGDIPGLGRLFRHDVKTKQKKELVILLQPTII